MAIDEGRFVDINGLEQWIVIRGRDLSNPVLLLLHGGPGFPISFMAPHFADWEQDYTLVLWDQPGGGATNARSPGREGPLSIERYVRDALAVAEYARARLSKDRIALLGNSWGTMLGVTMVQRRPELFGAYVGTSQVASGPDGRRLGYELGLKAARERGDAAAVAALETVGPPPYARFGDFLVRQTYTNPPGAPPSAREAAASAAMTRRLSIPPPAGASWIPQGVPPSDFMNVFMATQRAMFAETSEWRASDQGLAFKIPVLVVQGDQDLNTPLALARAWFDSIRAPHKAFEVLEGAGHNTLAFESEIHALINMHIRPHLAAR
jgi:proline iminopeptidase